MALMMLDVLLEMSPQSANVFKEDSSANLLNLISLCHQAQLFSTFTDVSQNDLPIKAVTELICSV